MKARLRLAAIPKWLRKAARDDWAAGKPLMLLAYAGHHHAIDLLLTNLAAFLEAGVFEEALVSAYCSKGSNHWSLPASTILALFSIGDRSRLLAAGDPLPDGDRFTVYRGVAGSGPHRKEDGISWTRNPNLAAWFVTRFAGDDTLRDRRRSKDPAVLQAEIARADVYVYRADVLSHLGNREGKGREEFVCSPAAWKQLERFPEPYQPGREVETQ